MAFEEHFDAQPTTAGGAAGPRLRAPLFENGQGIVWTADDGTKWQQVCQVNPETGVPQLVFVQVTV